jgi:hypothetical protein
MKAFLTSAACIMALSGSVRQVAAQEILQDTLPENHLLFTLHRGDGELTGGCDYLPGFTLSLRIRQEEPGSGLAVAGLMEAIGAERVNASLTYPNGTTTDVEFEVVRHRGVDDIYMKTTMGYFLWEAMAARSDGLSFVIDWWYTPPARPVDLATLQMAQTLLADSARWHQQDDRRCEDDVEDRRWSLFCALRYASMEKMGEYNHHNTAMNTVRFVVNDVVPDHGFEHPLMDYNNAPSTGHGDVLRVLDIARRRLQQEIDQGPLPAEH